MNSTSQTLKRGDLHKCPACGSLLSPLAVKCPECGYELSNIEANNTIKKLLSSLQDVVGTDSAAVSHKVQIIQNFPVPNTKEDIIEMLTVCRSNITSNAEHPQLRKAWEAKANQIVTKSQILLKGDKDAQFLINSIGADRAKKRKKRLVVIITATVIVIGLIFGFRWYYANAKMATMNQNTELATMQSNITKLIQTGEFDEAYDKIEELVNYFRIKEVDASQFDEIIGNSYLNLVIALLRVDCLEDAAQVGLDYRHKLGDESKWINSQIFKVLVQECDAQNVDDSPLR